MFSVLDYNDCWVHSTHKSMPAFVDAHANVHQHLKISLLWIRLSAQPCKNKQNPNTEENCLVNYAEHI